MSLPTHITSRLIPSSILVFAIILSGCGGGKNSDSPSTSSAASSVSSAVVSSSSSSIATSSSVSSSYSSTVISSSSSSSSYSIAVISSSSSSSSYSIAAISSSSSSSSSYSSAAISSSSSSSSSTIISSSSVSSTLPSSSSSSAISSSSSSAASSTLSAKTGAFIDSAVAGLHYETSPSGFIGSTNSNGEYQYTEGDTVAFSIGSLKFPTITAQEISTPLDMANSNDPQNRIALNIAALLQSLDTDGNPDNGISINYSMAAASAQAINFDQPYADFAALPAVVNLTANSGSTTKTLVNQSSALAHLQGSINKIDTASLVGTWSLQNSDYRYILFILDSSRYAQLVFDGGGATFNHGTYSWNKTTGDVTVNSIQVAGTALTKTPPFSGRMWINGDGLSLSGEGGDFELSRLTSTTNPLIGGWITGSSVVAFTENHYFFGQIGIADELAQSGAEYGTYNLDSDKFTVTTLADTNGQWGFSHPCNIVDTHQGNTPNDLSCLDGKNIHDTLTVSGDILDGYSAANVIANKTNAPPRNNEPEHYYFNRVKNDFETFGAPPSETEEKIIYADYYAAGTPGNTWTYTGNIIKTLLADTTGKYPNYLKLDPDLYYVINLDKSLSLIYDNGVDDTETANFMTSIPLDVPMDVDESTQYVISRAGSVTVPAGTFNDVIVQVWLDKEEPANSQNETYAPNSPYAVTDIEWYAKGIGRIQSIGVNAVNGEAEPLTQLTSYSITQ